MKKLLNILLLSLPLSFVQAQTVFPDTLIYVYKLHGQTRKYQTTFEERKDTLVLNWGIERNTKWQAGSYKMTPESRKSASSLTYLQPEDGNYITLNPSETFGMISQSAFRELKRNGKFTYNGMTYYQTENNLNDSSPTLIKVTEPLEGTEMWILDNLSLPIIWKMANNPIEINWEVEQVGNNPLTVNDELKQCIEKTGSVYYAYPANGSNLSAAPEGYSPFYISHYGRHGSRWIPSEDRYTKVIDVFEQNELTPLGEDVKERLKLVWANAKGNAGQLTPLGSRQHQEIAKRLYQNFPTVFTGNKAVCARSSVVQRCIDSMESFCTELQSMQPNLGITCSADSVHMNYIAYETPAMKAFGSKKSDWYQTHFSEFENKQVQPERILSTLFVNPQSIEQPQELMMGLYWIASDMQDVDLDLSFYDLFLTEELFDIWQVINYRMYICNSAAPLNDNIPAQSASSLLRNIVESADQAITINKSTAANLRFGHDTNLLRLMTLMQLKQFAQPEEEPHLYYQAWQDYKAAPMGANLQLIFYRDKQGNILVKFLHNEAEQLLAMESPTAPYYNWEEVKRFWANSH